MYNVTSNIAGHCAMDHAEIQWVGLYSQHLAQGLKHGDNH